MYHPPGNYVTLLERGMEHPEWLLGLIIENIKARNKKKRQMNYQHQH